MTDVPELQPSPSAICARREANLDGTLHVEQTCCETTLPRGNLCSRGSCGGRVHTQITYGGVPLTVCERCVGDRGFWRPRGTYLTSSMLNGCGTRTSLVYGELGGAVDVVLELSGIAGALAAGQLPDPSDVGAVRAWRLRADARDAGTTTVGALLQEAERAVARVRREAAVRVVSTVGASVPVRDPGDLPATGLSLLHDELVELRAQVTRMRPLVRALRRLALGQYHRRHTLDRGDRDLFAGAARLVADYDQVAPADSPELVAASPDSIVGVLPTAEDYDGAIRDLELARDQLVPDGQPCAICQDSGHQAFECHHNVLVVARAHALARERMQALHESLHALGVLGTA